MIVNLHPLLDIGDCGLTAPMVHELEDLSGGVSRGFKDRPPIDRDVGRGRVFLGNPTIAAAMRVTLFDASVRVDAELQLARGSSFILVICRSGH